MKELVNRNQNYILFIENLKAFCFPKIYPMKTTKKAIKKRLLACLLKDERKVATPFLEYLDHLSTNLQLDAASYLDFDPAAIDLKEVVYAYPGFLAVLIYRVAHFLGEYGAYYSARLFSEFAHEKTGIDIHYRAKIGAPFFIDHGTGVVIGATTIIKSNVRIYQGVTLGALSLEESQHLKDKKRHPTIEEDVTIYAYATILGADTIIGAHSIIGTNVVIKESIPAFSLAVQETREKRYKLLNRKEHSS